MGIGNTARETVIIGNQRVMNWPERCVRFLCEKPSQTSQRQRSPANVALVVAVVGARPRDSESRAFVRLPYLPAMRIARGGIDYIAQHESLCHVESTPGERCIRNLTCSPERQHPAESKRELLR